MGIEIERKFLVRSDGWRAGVMGECTIRQGYIAHRGDLSVRVRQQEREAWLTIKSGLGVRRNEYEYPIPRGDAEALLGEAVEGGVIEKTRYRVRVGEHLWEVDVFEGENAGLVLAEVELAHEDEPFERPGWAGEEVTGDPRYYNLYLAKHPYRRW